MMIWSEPTAADCRAQDDAVQQRLESNIGPICAVLCKQCGRIKDMHSGTFQYMPGQRFYKKCFAGKLVRVVNSQCSVSKEIAA